MLSLFLSKMKTPSVFKKSLGALAFLILFLPLAQVFFMVAFHQTTSAAADQQQTALSSMLEQSKTTTTIHDVTTRKDGTFNGLNLIYRDQQFPTSHAHCVGENYREHSWIGRSCDFRYLCFDTEQHEFVLLRSQTETKLTKALGATNHNFTDVSTTISNDSHVSIGGINLKWNKEGYDRLKWFPKIVDVESMTEQTGFYELPSDVVWIPIHSLAGYNPGHLVWDDLLPTYTLLSMFMHLDDKKRPLLMRMVLRDPLWASCDFEPKKKLCQTMIRKFIPMMGMDPTSFSTFHDFAFNTTNGEPPKSKYVCARHGAAGIGMLTDHGTKLHGWSHEDYETTHNHGRAANFYQFRNFCLQNLGIPVKPANAKPPFKVTFSVSSSARAVGIYGNLDHQIDAVEKAFRGEEVIVQKYKMSDLSLKEQVQIAADSNIFITMAGGGAVTAFFLPKGSSLILYYDEMGGVHRGRPNKRPARLDWDIFNNAAHISAHWLPLRTFKKDEDVEALVQLIRYELDSIKALSQ